MASSPLVRPVCARRRVGSRRRRGRCRGRRAGGGGGRRPSPTPPREPAAAPGRTSQASYPAHVAITPLCGIQPSRSRNPRSAAAYAPHPSPPGARARTSPDPSAQRAGAVKTANPLHAAQSDSRPPPTDEAVLDGRRPAKLHHRGVHLTHGTCRGARNGRRTTLSDNIGIVARRPRVKHPLAGPPEPSSEPG
jgi:hypothetical protein